MSYRIMTIFRTSEAEAYNAWVNKIERKSPLSARALHFQNISKFYQISFVYIRLHLLIRVYYVLYYCIL